jgi:hypothetical protein
MFAYLIHFTKIDQPTHSKRNLPMPPSLPAPLKGFLLNAPVVPPTAGAAPAPAAAPAPTAAPVHVPAATPSPSAPAAAAGGGGISSAFDALDVPAAPEAVTHVSYALPTDVFPFLVCV